MAAKHYLIIDGSNIMHANHNATKLSIGGFQVQAIFGTLKSMRALLQANPGAEPIVLWDGRAQFRYDLFPGYKDRSSDDPKDIEHREAYKKQAPYLEKMLQFLGVRQMRSPHLEADDLAGYMIPALAAAGHRITMVTGDKDWLQMVGPNVTWFDPIRDRKCNVDNFLEFTGYFNARAFIQGKALVGDASDTIPGVGGIGEKGAPEFLAKWKSVEAFFAAYDAGTAGKLGKKHTEFAMNGRAAFERNMKLMDWSQSRRPEPGEIITTQPAIDIEKFELMCQKLAFVSILRELGMFLRAFNITKATT